MRTLKNITKICVVLSLAAAGAAAAQNSALEEAAKKENLERVQDGPWQETWVNPDIDFSQYDKLLPGDAVFQYRDIPAPRRSSMMSRQGSQQTEFPVPEEEQAEFQQIVGDAFRAELIKGENFSLTDTADEQTILVRGGLVDIVSRVPPQYLGANDVFLSRVGEATLVLEFVDPNTGDKLAVIMERGVIGANRGDAVLDGGAVRTTPGRIRQAVEVWATASAKKLRNVLDDALGG